MENVECFQDQPETSSPSWNDEVVSIPVDEFENETLQLALCHNSSLDPHPVINKLNLAIGELVEKLENSKTDCLDFDHKFRSGGSLQFQITMEERVVQRGLVVPKMYAVKGHKYREKTFDNLPVCAICERHLWLQR